MKKISKIILGICCSSSLLLSSCIEETFPTNSATDEQLTSSSKATEALLWAMPFVVFITIEQPKLIRNIRV